MDALTADLSDPYAPKPAVPFDYGLMEPAAADEARAVAERYRARSKSYVMDTGRDLLAMKERLDHGLFLKWVGSEMSLTARTAQNFMQTAAQLGSKSETVSHLPPTTLYKLASPSLPDPIREEIVGRLDAGEALTPKAIDSRIWEARKEAEREAAEAKLTPDERKRQAKSKRDADARRRREHERWQAEQAEERARKGAATKELAELLAARLDDESYTAAYRLLRDCDLFNLRHDLASAYGPTAEAQAHSAALVRDLDAHADA
ncbi:DUF3102 domain-containing protein [Methylobacterium thuringiense]|uniref:DUF3102 domain-containing protein n=1 Tax=Methylobacterium thuringiense TaxID=1003091 RepID=A0ABQ4TPT6_9HYPH|nr:DUF3102 domain-containing protein [Methylobacterium thuringiense]GJE57316.1 hypothetical protein EKPJFOCH_3830 [Methylobacterium thuringiense]